MDFVKSDLAHVDGRLREIQSAPGVDVFALDERMLARSIELRVEVPEPALKPFDEVILAAVLERATALGSGRRIFCTLDLDLSPVARDDRPRKHSSDVYASAQLEVRTSFDLSDV